MILFLHHRYRTLGGEERAVDGWRALVEGELGEPTALLGRDSARIGTATAAAGLLGGGLRPAQVTAAVREGGARVVHAHNLQPTFGPRALEAARAAGAGVVLHLHNYRLVCAVATCVDPEGDDCTRCHGRDTLPGIGLRCRGSAAESLVFGAGLALSQRRLLDGADVVIVPSTAALERLELLGLPLAHRDVRVLAHPPGPARAVARSGAVDGRYAIVVSRLAPEKGVADAIDACARVAMPLVVCGDGPLRTELERRAQHAGADVRFTGRVPGDDLARLRAGARLAIVPSRAQETFGLAALEAMAAGLPVAATRAGALAELGDGVVLVPPGDVAALAAAIGEVSGNAAALGERALASALSRRDPAVAAAAIRGAYASAQEAAATRRATAEATEPSS